MSECNCDNVPPAGPVLVEYLKTATLATTENGEVGGCAVGFAAW